MPVSGAPPRIDATVVVRRTAACRRVDKVRGAAATYAVQAGIPVPWCAGSLVRARPGVRHHGGDCRPAPRMSRTHEGPPLLREGRAFAVLNGATYP